MHYASTQEVVMLDYEKLGICIVNTPALKRLFIRFNYQILTSNEANLI